MVTYFNKGTIWKGSDCVIPVKLSPCYADIDFSQVDNFVVNFFTTASGSSITKTLEDFSITGDTGSVHFQNEELQLLDDGVLRYVAEYSYGGDSMVFAFSSNFYLKTPADYTPIELVTEEDVAEIVAEQIADSTALTEIVQAQVNAQMTGYTPDSEFEAFRAWVEGLYATKNYVNTNLLSLSNMVNRLSDEVHFDYYNSGRTDEQIAAATQNMVSSSTISTIWVGTQAQYDSISPKSTSTLYFIQPT